MLKLFSLSGLLWLLACTQLVMGKAMQNPPGSTLYRFSQLSIQDGLSHNQVNHFLKDTTGYVWIGTPNGLNRYNGYEVKVFNHNPQLSGSLDDDFIERLFLDPAGNVWVKTSEGFNVYDPVNEKFQHDIQSFLHKPELGRK